MSAVPPQQTMLHLLTSYWTSQCLHVVAKLGVADLLKDGPQSGAQLAQATATNPDALYRVLRALASVGVFAEVQNGHFGLTPLARCLMSDAPGSQRSFAIMAGEEHFRCWQDLLYSVQTGKPAFDHIFGKPIFDYLAENPPSAAIFDDAMTGVHGMETAAMLEAYDFGRFGTVVDVGGGIGNMIGTVLQQTPALRGILFDRADVIERARTRLQAAGLASRCQTVAGSFFEEVPSGGDAYMMRHIIHDWDDERCRLILANCRKVMAKTSKLLVLEMVIPPGNEASFAKFLDVNMLLIPGGKERTEAEYRELYQEAGFRLTRVVPTRTEISIIEGEPV